MHDDSSTPQVPVSHRTRLKGRPPIDGPGYFVTRSRKNWRVAKEKARQRSAAAYAARAAWRDEVKRMHGCQMCGESDPACLEFHHVDPETFAFSVGSINYAGKSKTLAEIAKCAVVCSNCHKKAHRNGLPIDLQPIDLDALPPFP